MRENGHYVPGLGGDGLGTPRAYTLPLPSFCLHKQHIATILLPGDHEYHSARTQSNAEPRVAKANHSILMNSLVYEWRRGERGYSHSREFDNEAAIAQSW